MTGADGGADEVVPTERAAAIVACSPHGIVEADPQTGVLTWANPTMESMFGWPSGGLVGRSFAELHPPDALDEVAASFARIGAGDLSPAIAVPCRRVDGTEFFCDIHPGAVEVPDGRRLVAFFTEVTDRHVLQQRLLGAEAVSHQGSWELDHADGTLFWSPEMHRLLGHDERAPAPGVPWVLERVHPADQEWVERVFEESLALGQPYVIEHRMELDQRTIWVQATGEHVLDESGHPVISRGTLRDITVERERNDRARITDLLTTLGSITGDLSTETDNLLSVIVNAVELLRDDITPSPETDELVHLVEEACRRGQVLTRRLGGLAQRGSAVVADVDVALQLESLAPLLRSVTGSVAQLRLESNGEALTARLDPDGLATAIINLVSNARDAMSGRSGGSGHEVVVTASSVRVGENGRGTEPGEPDDVPTDLFAGSYVRVDVTDTGHGIPEELLDRIFETFWTSKSEGRGNGLGLAMVQDFAARTGGKVTVRSTVDVGTTVTLWLPAGPAYRSARPTRVD